MPIDWNVLGAKREEEVVADIFISYAREDRVTASRLADRFGDCWTVFWDRDLIAGDNWEQSIEAEANRARCVVALWSAASVESTEVRKEALIGWRRHVLVPAFLESVDPPSDFREIHASDLRGWEVGADTPGLADLIHAIASLIGCPAKDSHDYAGRLRDRCRLAKVPAGARTYRESDLQVRQRPAAARRH